MTNTEMTNAKTTDTETSPAQQSTEPRKQHIVIRVLRKFGFIVLGILLYAVCIDMFGGYPQVHSELLNWIAVVALALFAGVVWVIDERRRGTYDDE